MAQTGMPEFGFAAPAEFARRCLIVSPHAAKSDSTVQLPASWSFVRREPVSRHRLQLSRMHQEAAVALEQLTEPLRYRLVRPHGYGVSAVQ